MTRASLFVSTLGLASLAIACGAAPAPPPCPAPRVSQAGWQTISQVVIQYRIPPGLHEAPPEIADSWIRRYLDADGRSVLMLEYGGRPSNPDVEQRGRACSEVIGGRRVRLVTARVTRKTQTGSPYVASVVWEDAEPGNTLSIWAEAPDPERLRLLLAVVRTVRFR
jgi:hypothetical protein